MTKPIVVTGASGVMGRALVAALSAAGLPVRRAVRHPEKYQDGIDTILFDYHHPSTVAPALAGAGGLLLMAPPLDGNSPAELGPVIDSAKAAAVEHIVFISAFGANQSEQSPLRIIEHLVMDSGIPYSILRPNFVMENFSEGFLAGSIKAQSGIFLAAGDSKTSFISARDIAAVGSTLFQKPATGQELDLTGPEALNHTEVARFISEASGRAVTYHALTEDEMAAGARGAGMPEAAIGYLKVLYGAVRAGYAAGVTDTVAIVTGRNPLAFRDFAQINAAAWK